MLGGYTAVQIKLLTSFCFWFLLSLLVLAFFAQEPNFSLFVFKLDLLRPAWEAGTGTEGVGVGKEKERVRESRAPEH